MGYLDDSNFRSEKHASLTCRSSDSNDIEKDGCIEDIHSFVAEPPPWTSSGKEREINLGIRLARNSHWLLHKYGMGELWIIVETLFSTFAATR